MDLTDPATLTWSVIGGVAIAILAFLLSQHSTDFANWVAKKNYQYEVTFSLYMLTPTEKFIFNSILFLFTSTLTIAAALYLPEHITFLSRRAFYYYRGDMTLASTPNAASTLSDTASKTSEAVLDAAAEMAKTAYSAAVSTAAAVSEALKQAADNQ